MLQSRADVRRHARSTRGFTLIELVVVVVVLAALAAIAGVAYNQFVSHSRDTAIQADAKQVGTAVQAYSARSDLPYSTTNYTQAKVAAILAGTDPDALGAVTLRPDVDVTGMSADPDHPDQVLVRLDEGTRAAILRFHVGDVGGGYTVDVGGPTPPASSPSDGDGDGTVPAIDASSNIVFDDVCPPGDAATCALLTRSVNLIRSTSQTGGLAYTGENFTSTWLAAQLNEPGVYAYAEPLGDDHTRTYVELGQSDTYPGAIVASVWGYGDAGDGLGTAWVGKAAAVFAGEDAPGAQPVVWQSPTGVGTLSAMGQTAVMFAAAPAGKAYAELSGADAEAALAESMPGFFRISGPAGGPWFIQMPTLEQAAGCTSAVKVLGGLPRTVNVVCS